MCSLYIGPFQKEYIVKTVIGKVYCRAKVGRRASIKLNLNSLCVFGESKRGWRVVGGLIDFHLTFHKVIVRKYNTKQTMKIRTIDNT